MRTLHFHTLAPHPKVAPMLAKQANDALDPLRRYLGRAIKGARKRQQNHPVEWSLIRDTKTIALTPIDTLVEVVLPPPQLVITNWPEDKQPDASEDLMLVEQGETCSVDSLDVSDGRVSIRVEPESRDLLAAAVEGGQKIFWCGDSREYQLLSVDEPAKPLVDVNGETIRERERSQRGSSTWQILIDGQCEAPLGDGEVTYDTDVLPASDGLRTVRDPETNQTWSVDSSKLKFEDDELPESDVLVGNNGIRFSWKATGGRQRQSGVWVQLELPDGKSGRSGLDSRSLFCEPGVGEVWTQKKHSRETIIGIHRADRENYRLLLKQAPPENVDRLYLPVNTINLQRQRAAVHQLKDAPLPHHRGLLRLLENPDEVNWQGVRRSELEQWLEEHGHVEWHELTDDSYDGTEAQREFVRKARNTSDFAFLDGPPGSGKTTAICELVLKMANRGKKILLCASTHCAIDNVLERVADRDCIEAVRIGRESSIDERVQSYQLEKRVETLLEEWREDGGVGVEDEQQLREMATRMVVQTANLTCATTMGVVNHPLLKEATDYSRRAQSEAEWLTRNPHFDALVVDEASKTTLQEFLVPAMMAKKWIVVGDVRQLTPYVDQEEMAANLRRLEQDRGNEPFPPAHQRACLLASRLLSRDAYVRETRWLIVEQVKVLDALERELSERREQGGLAAEHGPVVRARSAGNSRSSSVNLADLDAGKTEPLLRLKTASVVLVSDGEFDALSDYLPGDLVRLSSPRDRTAPDVWRYRHEYYRKGVGAYDDPPSVRGKTLKTPVQAAEKSQEFLRENRWADEIAWRSVRLQELRRSDQRETLDRYNEQIAQLSPASVSIEDGLGAFRGLALPSLLESLQDGLEHIRTRRDSSLSEGMDRRAWKQRYVLLPYQHRMHPEISTFPRQQFYEDEALRDANTLENREEEVGWTYSPPGSDSRAIWYGVKGDLRKNKNKAEIDQMERLLRDFQEWAEEHPPRRDDATKWEVALLSFYVAQFRGIANMLRRVCGQQSANTRFEMPGVSITCGTVDRFQGREADVVMLSMRNQRRTGFMDSPNRLNVGITRARFLLQIVGNFGYFKGCSSTALSGLAKHLGETNIS